MAMTSVAGVAGLSALGGLGLAGVFGGNKSLSPIEKANLYYGQVGKLRARAALATKEKQKARLARKITRNENKLLKVATRQDTKAQRVPPKTFAELEARRAAYDYAIANPAPSRTGTRILKTL